MKTKNIKVTYSTRYGNRSTSTVPKIQMEGYWLEDLGFAVGSTIAVEYGDGSITIRPLTKEELDERRSKELSVDIRRRERELKALKQRSTYPQEGLGRVAEPSGRYDLSSKSSRKDR